MLKIIAEIGSVHDGSYGNACKLVEAVANCGADVVKFQTHIAEAETLKNAPSPSYFNEESRWNYFKRTSFSFDQWVNIKELCEKLQIEFLSSPFSQEAVEMLEHVGVGSYKIASGEVTNTPMLEMIAETKKPVYLSSGMSNWQELDEAVKILLKGGDLTIMQCTSAYPCPPERVGLNVISEMKDRYQLPVGFSDHTDGFPASYAAAALGAEVIEKHFTFSKLMYGSDAKHGMEPSDFKQFCDDLKKLWKMLQSKVDKNDIDIHINMRRTFQKSIVLNRDLKKGTILKFEYLSFKKPGDGIPASLYKDIIGRELNKDLSKNTKLKESDLS